MSQDFSKGYVYTMTDSVTFGAHMKSWVKYERKSIMLLSPLEIREAQLRSVTEIALKSLFYVWTENPIRYGFRASAKALRYSVNTTFKP